jgi:hypothetical protein
MKNLAFSGATNYFESTGFGSFLVKDVSNVPIPGATWLFGSGLFGYLITHIIRKQNKEI